MVKKETKEETLLGPYRVLDLTDAKGFFCGRMLADFGADVIKVEIPGGDIARKIGPFYKDIPDPEKSLYWFLYNANKRGITLNIETSDGQELFKRLVKTADFVIESFNPGFLDSLGLGFSALSEINPRIILTSITPFGQTGPKAHHKSSELTAWASGGMLYMTGQWEGRPVWVGAPQGFLHGGIEGAIGSLMAHWHRELTGEGQHVDVSIQAAEISSSQQATGFWDLNHNNPTRVGPNLGALDKRVPIVFPCKDGYVCGFTWMTVTRVMLDSMLALIDWMKDEWACPEWMAQMSENDWMREYGIFAITQEENIQEKIDRACAPFFEFLITKTKAEIFEQALPRHILLQPVATTQEIYENPQLTERDYWQNVDHPELGDTIIYPGPFAKMSETPWEITRRAPLIGEHNGEIYEKDLGLSKEQLGMLASFGVI